MAHSKQGVLFLLLLILSRVSLARPGGDPRTNPHRTFKIEDDRFDKDGSQFKILGGSVHYFRVHRRYWEDRLLRVKALGLNVVQTYVPWNLHQPQPDQVVFDENTSADLFGFLKIAQRLDLLVMLRPGPYICGEWDFGGFPAWLLAVQPSLRLRTSDPRYLNLVDKWWDVLLPKIFPFLYSEGGPIIMVQIENEYGSFGADKVYMKHLVTKARAHLGENIVLYTTDGADLEILQKGSLSGDDIYTVVDFPIEGDPGAAFKLQKAFNAPGMSPPLSSEFYTGWLTHWGESFSQIDPDYTAAALDRLLLLNASVVFYMVHGGTNFGFGSGANTGSKANDFLPDITSYDYDAPITEAGDCDGAKFKALKAVLSKYVSGILPDPPPLPARVAYGKVELRKLSSLFHVLEAVSMVPNGIAIERPIAMEMLGQVSGFILYRSTLPEHTKAGSKLFISEVHDRAQVFVSRLNTTSARDTQATHRVRVGTFDRWSSASLELPATTAFPGWQLDILVENMGRVNYGPFLYDPKGILSAVTVDGVPIVGWTAYPIPLDNVQHVTRESSYSGSVDHEATRVGAGDNPAVAEKQMTEGPSFYQGWLDVNQPADTFVSLRGWSKGLMYINGFNLGRFWPMRGPQCTLYVPAPLLSAGLNEMVLFELESPRNEASVDFTETPDFSCGVSSHLVTALQRNMHFCTRSHTLGSSNSVLPNVCFE